MGVLNLLIIRFRLVSRYIIVETTMHLILQPKLNISAFSISIQYYFTIEGSVVRNVIF